MLSHVVCKYAPVCRSKLCCTLLQVRICKERATGKIFAMKKLKKTEMVRRGQVSSFGTFSARLLCKALATWTAAAVVGFAYVQS